MPSDVERQPKTKSKKRRRIVVSETDSSDECDSPTVKTRRKQRINKLKNDIKNITKEKNGELEAAGSSQNVECDKKIELRTNGKNSSDDTDTELSHSKLISKPSKTSIKSPNTISDDKDVAATSSKSEEGKNDSESGDKCPICWVPFVSQEIAIPACCDHCFCLQCLLEWSKNTNTCPVDRLSFNKIEVRPNLGGKATRYVPIETRQNNVDRDDDVRLTWSSDSESFNMRNDHDLEMENILFSPLGTLMISSSEDADIYVFTTEDDGDEDDFCFSTPEAQLEERNSSSRQDDDYDDDDDDDDYDDEEAMNSYSPHDFEEDDRHWPTGNDDEEEDGHSFSTHDYGNEEEINYSSGHENEESSRYDETNSPTAYWPTSDDNDSPSNAQNTEEQSSSSFGHSSNHSYSSPYRSTYSSPTGGTSGSTSGSQMSPTPSDASGSSNSPGSQSSCSYSS